MAYTGTDKNPDYALAYEVIVEKQGNIDKETFKKYAKIGGAAGGAAICAAYGGAAVSPICAKIGGDVAAWLADKVPFASGGSWEPEEWWVNRRVPLLIAQGASVLEVQTYIFERDSFIAQRAEQHKESIESVDQRLTKAGLPGAPILPLWAPREGLYNTWLIVKKWLDSPPYTDYPSGLHVDWKNTGSVTSAKKYAKVSGLSVEEALKLTWYGVETPAPLSQHIDYSLVAAHATCSAQWSWWKEFLGACLPDLSMDSHRRCGYTPSQIKARYAWYKDQAQYTSTPIPQLGPHMEFPDESPRQMAVKLRQKLGDFKQNQFILDMTAHAIVPANPSSQAKKPTAAQKAVKVGLIGGAIWAIFRYFS